MDVLSEDHKVAENVVLGELTFGEVLALVRAVVDQDTDKRTAFFIRHSE
jgi:hypothetical protein